MVKLSRVCVLLCCLPLACGPSIILPGDTDAIADEGDESSGPGATSGMTTSDVPPNPSTTGVDTNQDSGDRGTFGDDTEDDADSLDGTIFIDVDDGPDCSSLPPGYSGHCVFECDLYAQDCPAGEKCMPWANDGGNIWNATRCSPVDETPAGVGQACTVEGNAVSGIDSCDVGAMCFYVDAETNEGACVDMCAGDPSDPICDDGSTCTVSATGILNLCLADCDPLGAPCPIDQVCAPSNDTFWCIPATDSLGYGESCDFLGQCGDGLACLDGAVSGCESDGCCAAFCSLAAGDPNPACPDAALGQTCQPWFQDKAPEGLGDLGVCVLGG